MVERVGSNIKHVMGVAGYPDTVKTLNQWKKAGFKIKEGVKGNLYCFSREKGLGAYYFTQDEVEPDSGDNIIVAAKKSFSNDDIWAHPGTKSLMAGKEIQENTGYLIVDIETTGFKVGEDEILQLAIIDSEGTVVFNDYFQPENKRSWPIASRITGIFPRDVAGYRLFKDALPQINEILNYQQCVIGYNIEKFDVPFLKAAGVEFMETGLDDVLFSVQENLISKVKNCRLETVSAYFDYDWSSHGKEHDALSDCFATLFVYNKIQDMTGFQHFGRPDYESSYMRKHHKYWSDEYEKKDRKQRKNAVL